MSTAAWYGGWKCYIFVPSGWLLDLKTIRNPPMLLNTPGVCNCDTISYCNTVFLFLACRFERKKNIYHYHHRCKLRAWSFFFFYYTRCNTPKHVRSSRGPSPRHCARATRLHSSFWRNVAAVASRWQHCVRFDRPEIWTSDLPLQRRTCCRLTN